jgi:hypothetical protein
VYDWYFRNDVLPYGKRKGFIPRIKEDFGDGGAFPEIHIAQYPLDMGRADRKSSAIVAVSVGATGGKKVFQSATDLVEKPVDPVRVQMRQVSHQPSRMPA